MTLSKAAGVAIRHGIELGAPALVTTVIGLAVASGHETLQGVVLGALVLESIAAILLAIGLERNTTLRLVSIVVHVAILGCIGWAAWRLFSSVD